jgi:DNA polymerase III subunit delta
MRAAGAGGGSSPGGPSLTRKALLAELAAGRLRRIYLLTGSELFLRRELVAAIETAALGPRPAPDEPLPPAYVFNRQLWNGEEARAGEILAAAQALPMFGKRRVVLVEGVDRLRKAERDAFAPGLALVSDTTVLILMADQLDGRLTFTRDLRAKAVEVPVEGLEGRELQDWIKDEVQRRGHRITPDAMSELILLSGSNLATLAGEIEKLSLYAGPAQAIDLAQVRQVATGGRGEELGELVRAVSERELGSALLALHRSLEAGEEPIRILALLQYRITDLWRCAERVGGWYRDEVRRAAPKWPPRAAAGAMTALAEADRLLKGADPEGALALGRRPGDRLVLELLIERLIGATAPHPRAGASAASGAEAGRRSPSSRAI